MNKKTLNAAEYVSNDIVQLIRGGHSFFELLEKLIDESQKTIHLQFYIYDGDETGGRIAQALIRAAQRRVNVFLVLDGYASRSLDSSIIDSLKSAGVHFRWFEPLFKSRQFYVGRRLHHKVFVADELHSLVGGLNISNRYNDMPDEPAWLDWAVYVKGKTSAGLYNRCLQIWSGKMRKFKVPSPRLPFTENSDCFVRIRINDWLRNKNQISRSYLEMFDHAETQITIMSSYFLPGRSFRKRMSLAAKRGVKIRIILTRISDILLAKQAERFFYPWLLKRNIEIYEYRKKVLHGKISTYDSHWVTVGSYNFNTLSAYGSIELNLDIHNPAFAHDVDQALETIIQQDCELITQETVNRETHIWNRLVQRFAYGVFRFLYFIFFFNFKQKKA